MDRGFVSVEIRGVRLRIATLHRDGARPPIVFLHGFGSTKEDYADIEHYSRFDGRPVLSLDAPGCGESECSELSKVSIEFILAAAKKVIDHYRLPPFHLVGHSMGGLAALLLAQQESRSVLSFSNIEGNIAPEDCFFSRQIFQLPAASADQFVNNICADISSMAAHSFPLYAASLKHKVRAGAVESIFRSIVRLTDNENLFAILTQLPIPTLFVYGDQNRRLSYLGALEKAGVLLTEIPHSSHFPMYSNPPALWDRIGDFIDLSDAASARA